MHGGGVLAAVAWPLAAGLLWARAAGWDHLSALGFGIVVSWILTAGCLGSGLAMLAGEDTRITRLLTGGLSLGDPTLDAVLVPGARPRWRGLPRVRHTVGYLAATGWILAVVYCGQLAAGLYHLREVVAMSILRLLMSVATWASVVAAAGAAEARRAAAYDLAVEGHARLRAGRLGARVTVEASWDPGEGDRPAAGGAPPALRLIHSRVLAPPTENPHDPPHPTAAPGA